MIKVCKGNSGGENAILKRVYILPLKKSEEQVLSLLFSFHSQFFLLFFGGGGGEEGVKEEYQTVGFVNSFISTKVFVTN